MKNFILNFHGGEVIIGRWRAGAGATTLDAIERALIGLRPGTLDRLARRNKFLHVVVAPSNVARHPNGCPVWCEGFTIHFSKKKARARREGWAA
jgi:hypothetical protein